MELNDHDRGAHIVITSTKPEADHAFLRDILKLPHVDEGGYLIFGLPPAEVSVHEADKDECTSSS